MKKLLLLPSLVLLAYGSSAQTKKVIVEDYTGINCGWCPEGTVILEGLHSNNPNSIIPVAMHGGLYEPSTSPLKNQDAETVISFTKPSGFPAGAVDRKKFSGESSVAVSRGKWTPYFNQQSGNTAIASIGFANLDFNSGTGEYTADVNVMFTADPGTTSPLSIQVYALEDSISASGSLRQLNSGSSSVQGGKSPLDPWWHNRTFRATLTGDVWGDVSTIPAQPVLNQVYTYKLKFTIPAGWDKENVNIVAFVANNTLTNKEIHNAEEVPASRFFPSSVKAINNEISIDDIYPNPSSINSVVNVPYTINTSSNVTMRVYSVVGQMVAEPYNSYEVSGSHIINWNPSNDNLTPGVYIIEVSTPKGKQVQRVNLF